MLDWDLQNINVAEFERGIRTNACASSYISSNVAKGNVFIYDYLAEGPVITVPTITLEGDANGAPHPDPSSYARKFSGKYSHRLIQGGVGHNLPQEAPREFAEAVMNVAQS